MAGGCVLVDQGVYFFDLRAICIQGRLEPAEVPPSAPAGHRGFEVVPAKAIAWDRGTLREGPDGS